MLSYDAFTLHPPSYDPIHALGAFLTADRTLLAEPAFAIEQTCHEIIELFYDKNMRRPTSMSKSAVKARHVYDSRTKSQELFKMATRGLVSVRGGTKGMNITVGQHGHYGPVWCALSVADTTVEQRLKLEQLSPEDVKLYLQALRLKQDFDDQQKAAVDFVLNGVHRAKLKTEHGELTLQYMRTGLHADDGPALVWSDKDGEKMRAYAFEGNLHRTSGPALSVQLKDGGLTMVWAENGTLREDHDQATITNQTDKHTMFSWVYENYRAVVIDTGGGPAIFLHEGGMTSYELYPIEVDERGWSIVQPLSQRPLSSFSKGLRMDISLQELDEHVAKENWRAVFTEAFRTRVKDRHKDEPWGEKANELLEPHAVAFGLKAAQLREGVVNEYFERKARMHLKAAAFEARAAERDAAYAKEAENSE